MSERLTTELRRLARLFTAASSSLLNIADELDRRAAPDDSVSPDTGSDEPHELPAAARAGRLVDRPDERPALNEAGEEPAAWPGPEQPAAESADEDRTAPGDAGRPAEGVARGELPWDAIVERAIELLRAEPERSWKPAEMCRAVRDSGVKLVSLQGVHFGLMPRLRHRAAVIEVEGGFQASALVAAHAAEERSRPSEPEKPPGADGSGEASAPPARRELPWGEIVRAAMGLLRSDPDRRWGQAELVRAVRDSGVALERLQGVHFGLTSRLSGLGAVEHDDEGKLRLSALVGGREWGPPPGGAAETGPAPADDADALAEEIDACELFLERMSSSQRTSQVAVWAGRARELQERWSADPQVVPAQRTALRRVFGRLTRIAGEQQCGWIDALSPEWSMSWTVYTRFHASTLAGEEPSLNRDEEQAFWRGRLRGLLSSARHHVASSEAAEMLARASAVLDPGEHDLQAAVARFGAARRAVPPLVRRSEAAPAGASALGSATPAPAVAAVVPAAVGAAARGKRALLLGGQGSREEHRKALEAALGFAELEWVFSERGAVSHYPRLEERVRHDAYDVVFFLAGYTSHKAVPFLRQCKTRGVPVVYLARGYSLAQVCRAIEEQWLARPSARVEA
ncbi:MAG: hypothetical protein ACYC8T_00775 [Myxococcaceae bacterium]